MTRGAATTSTPAPLPARLFGNAARFGDRVAHRYRVRGTWFPVGWATLGHLVRDRAATLIELGHAPAEPVVVLSRARREALYWDLATLAGGGIAVGLYPSLRADVCQDLVRRAGARFAVVENTAQLAKLEGCLEPAGPLRGIVLIDSPDTEPRDPRVVPARRLLAAAAGTDRAAVDARLAALGPHDAALFLYSSGTTGTPKAAMLSHGNLSAALEAVARAGLLRADDRCFSALPLASPVQRLLDYAALWTGVPSAYPGHPEVPLADLAQARATVLALMPHTLEHWYRAVYEPAADSPALQGLLAWTRDLSRQEAHDRRRGQLGPSLQAQLALARRLVFHRLRRRLGRDLRLIVTAGAGLAPEIVEFLHAAGVPIAEGWGMAETFALATLALPEDRRRGSAGQPLPGIELAIADDGELLVRGPQVFSGYLRADAATTSAFTSSGYFRTGDLARLDDDRFLYLSGRHTELIVTQDGHRISPQPIEHALAGDPRIAHVVVVGDRRPYLGALVAVARAYRTRMDSTTLERMLAGIIATRNTDLLRHEQIRAFRLLPHELSEDSGELTPTRTVRRAVVLDKFQYLVDEMYE
ncbi:AMP-dependent synthetase/ligase [Haliangium sp.]|uniref:AMP-dependent synthetase/ligase n=1 Tax=Haliangium sp. TaxID=2663208 RepID=UPI003D12DEEB